LPGVADCHVAELLAMTVVRTHDGM
jgi:hypothetical protein